MGRRDKVPRRTCVSADPEGPVQECGFTDSGEIIEELVEALGIRTRRLSKALRGLRAAIDVAGPRALAEILAVEAHLDKNLAARVIRILRSLPPLPVTKA